MEGDVPEAARRARGATEDAHPEHLLGTRQQAQRYEKLLLTQALDLKEHLRDV